MEGNPSNQILILSVVLFVITLIVGIIALWRAARNNQKTWFVTMVVMLIYPPLSLLASLVYLFIFSKKKLKFEEIKSWFGR